MGARPSGLRQPGVAQNQHNEGHQSGRRLLWICLIAFYDLEHNFYTSSCCIESVDISEMAWHGRFLFCIGRRLTLRIVMMERDADMRWREECIKSAWCRWR